MNTGYSSGYYFVKYSCGVAPTWLTNINGVMYAYRTSLGKWEVVTTDKIVKEINNECF